MRRLLIWLVVILAAAHTTATAQILDKVWQTGLFCQSVFPDRALDNFFVIDDQKSRILVASFNDDKVSFDSPPLNLNKTPDELVNRKSGLSLNRKTLRI